MGARVSQQTQEGDESTAKYEAQLQKASRPIQQGGLKSSAFDVERLGPRIVQDLLDEMNELFPVTQFRRYRDWDAASKEFDKLIELIPRMVKDINRVATYNTKYKSEIGMLVVPGGRPVWDIDDQLKQRANGVYPAMYRLVQRLNKLNDAWWEYLDTRQVSRDFLEAAKLTPIEVYEDANTVSFPAELRALTVLNYFIRKWSELTALNTFLKWLEAEQFSVSDEEKYQRQRFFQAELTRHRVAATSKNVIMSDELLYSISRQSEQNDELWAQYLSDRGVAAVPCLIVVGTHGGISVETDTDFTATLPAGTSMTRVVKTPPGYINRYACPQVAALVAQLQDLVSEDRTDLWSVMSAVNNQFPGESLTNIFELPVIANLDKTFAKRYLPGQPYLNKTYTVSSAEYIQDRKVSPYCSTITLVMKDKVVNLLAPLTRKRKKSEEIEVSLESVVAMAREESQVEDGLDITVVDLSCSTFKIDPVSKTMLQRAQTGYLGYESDPEFQTRVRTVAAQGLLGGFE